MLNICYCGVESGYPHAKDCPYPQYRADAKREANWFAARRRLLDARRMREAELRSNFEISPSVEDLALAAELRRPEVRS